MLVPPTALIEPEVTENILNDGIGESTHLLGMHTIESMTQT